MLNSASNDGTCSCVCIPDYYWDSTSGTCASCSALGAYTDVDGTTSSASCPLYSTSDNACACTCDVDYAADTVNLACNVCTSATYAGTYYTTGASTCDAHAIAASGCNCDCDWGFYPNTTTCDCAFYFDIDSTF